MRWATRAFSSPSAANNMANKLLILKESDVRACLSMKDCLEANRQAFLSLAEGGGANVPTRIGLPFVDHTIPNHPTEDWTLFKPAAYYDTSSTSQENSIMGMKLVSVRANNPSQRSLPLVPATVLLVDVYSGIVKAILSATYLTAARTAAGSALATQFMMKQKQQDSIRHLVLFGAGLQAECHIHAIKTALEENNSGKEEQQDDTIQKITIINRTKERAEKLIEETIVPNNWCSNNHVVLLNDTTSVHETLSTADVIVTATNTDTPLFQEDIQNMILPPGCHINGVGSYTPNMCELPNSVVNRCHVIYDTPEAKQVGDLKHLLSAEGHPMTAMGDVLLQEQLSTNSDNDNVDCTFFKSVGTAIQDVFTANCIVQRCQELGKGIGTEMDMAS